MKSLIAVPVQFTSTSGAPRPGHQVGDVDRPEVDAEPGPAGRVRDRGVQLGPGEQQDLAGAGRTTSSWSGWWSMAPGRAWLSRVTWVAVVSRLALFS